MKYLCYGITITVLLAATSCRTTKKISKVIATKDTLGVVVPNQSADDSLRVIKNTMAELQKRRITFKTFSAKIKIDYEDNKGKQPDVNAYVRIFSDSLIWVNIRSAFLDIDAFRVLITRDSVFVLNRLQKEAQFRSIDYLQEVTQIPFDFGTLQDLLVGNPVFFDSTVAAYRKTDNHILVSVVGSYFKHLLTLDAANNNLLHSKLDDVDINRNRTADITYSDYEYKNEQPFSAYRAITVSEKNKLDIRMNYKQYEFNKDLSISFSVPKNYKRN